MSDFETQARIVHQSNQIRDELKNIAEWEKEMKQKEAKRNASSSNEEVITMSSKEECLRLESLFKIDN